MDNEKKRSKKISFKFAVGFLILGLFVIISSCVVGYIKYTSVIAKMYNDSAYRIAHTAMESIDGDLIEEYTERIHQANSKTLPSVSRKIQSEDAYQELLDTLTILRKSMKANYIYIADQRDAAGKVGSTLTYLFDVDNPEDDVPAFVPGDTSKMNESFLADSNYIYETGKRSDNYFYSHSDFGYNTSAIVPIQNSDGQVVAIIGVELAMKTLQNARMEYILYTVALGAALTAFIIFLFLIYIKQKVIRPINIITEEAEAFVNNETEVSDRLSQISTGDEIQQMAGSILQMEHDIGSYIKELTQVTAERERIGAELNVATRIQADMLPSIFPAFPERDEFDIYASMVPAKEVGGDFYDFFMIGEDRLAMVVADVSGKGVPAALFMVITKTLLKNYAQNDLSVKETLETVNDKLCENNKAEMFVTVWLGILDIPSGKLTCANAGHEDPVLYRQGQQYELLKNKHGFVLAGMEHMRQREYEIQLNPGDKLFLYTDGVVEATNANEELYGAERMVKALNKTVDADTEHTLAILKEDIDQFVADAPQFDDITMLCLKYKGVGENMEQDSETSSAKELTLDASLENVQAVVDFAEEALEAMNAPIKVRTQINIAIDEIFSNIARYAYTEAAGMATVRIEPFADQSGVTLTFVDQGIPYNPLEKEDPDVTLSADEREIGGLGIFMVKKSMDEMQYEYKDGQNVLRIGKRF